MRQSGAISKKSPCPQAEVQYIRFSALSKEDIQASSVAEITENRLYEGNRPVRGGPNDLRLGVTSKEFPC